jgi:hydrogenase-4 component B
MMVFEGSELVALSCKAFIILFLSGILALPFVPARFKSLVSFCSVIAISIITSTLALFGLSHGGVEYLISGGAFFGEIPLRIDALCSWFILIVNFTCLTGVLFGAGYLKSSSAGSSFLTFHWILFNIFHSSMLLVCMVQHGIAFLVAWEFMSISSFLLVLFDYSNPKVLKAGMNYIVQMHLSVILLTVAFIWVYAKTGTFDFKGINDFFGSNINIWLFLVFFAGFGLKAGFIGLHTWLPHAHPAAPSHISGVMSGVIVKMGIYGIFRIISFLKADYLLLGDIVLSISILTGLFGIMNSAVHRDFKKMLAYCTIENIGLIGIGIGLGLIGMGRNHSLLMFFGFGGALLHTLNHSLFKSLLFYSAGSVYKQTHTRDMDKLGGLIRTMPHSALLFLTGAVAIAGIPPLNGFISEFLLYMGILTGINSAGISQITLMILTFAGMSLIGGISILTFTKTFGTVFLGSPRQQLDKKPSEVPYQMLIPQYLIIALMIVIALFPGFFINMAGKAICFNNFPIYNFELAGSEKYIAIMKNIRLASLFFLIIAGALFFIPWIILSSKGKQLNPTWGCGYIAPNSRMQYTGKSFSKTFGKLMNFIMIEKKGFDEIGRNEIFPESRKYRSFYLDAFETKIINPIILLLTRFINLFQFVQNGRIQAYVIYGIVFILVIFICTVLNFWH